MERLIAKKLITVFVGKPTDLMVEFFYNRTTTACKITAIQSQIKFSFVGVAKLKGDDKYNKFIGERVSLIEAMHKVESHFKSELKKIYNRENKIIGLQSEEMLNKILNALKKINKKNEISEPICLPIDE